jgi:hypothetical protein
MNTDGLEDDDLDIENEVEDWEPEDWDIDDMVASRVNEKLGVEDYAHHNECAFQMWWLEEGRW